MQFQTQVGPQTASDGAFPIARSGKLGDVVVSELNGRYYENTYRKNCFFGANTAVQALSVNSTTYTGLALANPAASTVNLVLLEVTAAVASATTGVTEIVLGYAPTVALTTGSSSGPNGKSTLVGGATVSAGLIGASATLGAAPTICRALAGFTATTVVSGLAIKDDVGGALIIPPGQLVCIEAVTTAISVIASFTWAEIAI